MANTCPKFNGSTFVEYYSVKTEQYYACGATLPTITEGDEYWVFATSAAKTNDKPYLRFGYYTEYDGVEPWTNGWIADWISVEETAYQVSDLIFSLDSINGKYVKELDILTLTTDELLDTISEINTHLVSMYIGNHENKITSVTLNSDNSSLKFLNLTDCHNLTTVNNIPTTITTLQIDSPIRWSTINSWTLPNLTRLSVSSSDGKEPAIACDISGRTNLTTLHLQGWAALTTLTTNNILTALYLYSTTNLVTLTCPLTLTTLYCYQCTNLTTINNGDLTSVSGLTDLQLKYCTALTQVPKLPASLSQLSLDSSTGVCNTIIFNNPNTKPVISRNSSGYYSNSLKGLSLPIRLVGLNDNAWSTWNRYMEDAQKDYIKRYIIPTVDLLVQRCNSEGEISEEGEYVKYTSNITGDPYNSTEYALRINDGTQEVLSRTGLTVTSENTSTKVTGNIGNTYTYDIGQTYNFTATLVDTTWNNVPYTITNNDILTNTFYTIHIRPEGKQISLGGSATLSEDEGKIGDYGLFKCYMNSIFNQDAQFNNDILFSYDTAKVYYSSTISDIYINESYSGNTADMIRQIKATFSLSDTAEILGITLP